MKPAQLRFGMHELLKVKSDSFALYGSTPIATAQKAAVDIYILEGFEKNLIVGI